MDQREREHFYTPEDDDDDAELELEAPDPELIAREQNRAKEAIEAHKMAIDIDELYRESDRDRAQELLEKWTKGFDLSSYRFQVKHLLIATAVLAILLTLYTKGLLGSVLAIAIMFSVMGLFLYLQWQQKQAEDELARKRHEMYERRRAYLDRKLKTGHTEHTEAVEVPATLDEMETLPAEKKPFQFQFSMMQLMGAMTVAAVIFGVMQLLGGPSSTATILGFVALIGLVVHGLGFEPPPVVALGWWVVLVLYVALSIVNVFWDSVT